MSKKKLDLTMDDVLEIHISNHMKSTAQIVVKLKGTDENNVDIITGRTHTLTIGGVTYTVGNGLTIVSGSLNWTFAKSAFTASQTVGKLEADSNDFNYYYTLKIVVWVQ